MGLKSVKGIDGAGWQALIPTPVVIRHIVLVIAAYICAAVVVLACVLSLRYVVSAQLVRHALAYYFIASLASGVEPGSAKAVLLRPETIDGRPDLRAYLLADLVKSILVAPILILVWHFADPDITLASLAWTPLITFGGFAATDLRLNLDVQGRHGSALWFKQGSHAGSFAVLAIAICLGACVPVAIGAAAVTRCAVAAALAITSRPRRATIEVWTQGLRLLRQRTWVALMAASAVAALGGSIDRVIGLRYLPAADYAAYYLLFETLTRFWLVPFMLNPIVFARRAAGQPSSLLIRRAWQFLLLAGAGFLAVVTVAALLLSGPIRQFLGLDFGLLVVPFTLAVVINGFAQLRITELQAGGSVRAGLWVSAVGAGVGLLAFASLVHLMGVNGLLWGWLIKSAVEFGLAMVLGRRG